MIEILLNPSFEFLKNIRIPDDIGVVFHYNSSMVRNVLERVSAMKGADLYLAMAEDLMVGYLAIHPPDPRERWASDFSGEILTLGVVEVCRSWMRKGIGKMLMNSAFGGNRYDDKIVICSIDSRFWDLESTGLTKSEYRFLMMRFFREFGFNEFVTDDVDVSEDPLNLFVARIGQSVKPELYSFFCNNLIIGDDLKRKKGGKIYKQEESLSIQIINNMPEEKKISIYRRLIPEEIFRRFKIDPNSFTDERGNRVVNFYSPRDRGFVRIEIRIPPESRDPVFLLKIDTTPYNYPELAFIIMNDPSSPRFNIDVDEKGRDTRLGTLSRNIKEELRAMQAGLAPGQVRKGLGLLGRVLMLVEEFTNFLGKDMFYIQPLYYHNAIVYERYGFGYETGEDIMRDIDRGFQKGGYLYERMDNSTPFRRRGMEETVRGRSWAIHDGILDGPWISPRMFKKVGVHMGICTFPGHKY